MEDINGWQFALLVVGGYLGGGIFQFPRELVQYGGSDALWAFIGIVALFALLFWLYVKVAALTVEQPLGVTMRQVLTPVLGWPLQLARLGLHFMLAVLVIGNFGQVMRTFFLMGTPAWAIEAVLAGVALGIAWYGTAVLGRTLETLFVPTLIGSVIIGFLVLHRLHYAWALEPSTHVILQRIMAGTYRSAYIFIGFEALVQAYAHVRVDRRRAARRWLWRLYIASVGFFAFGLVVTMGTEGPYGMPLMQWPPVSALRLADITGFFISKLGLLVVVLWGVFAMAFVAVRLWCLAQDFGQSHHTAGSWRYRWLLMGTALAVWGVAQAFHTVVGLVAFFQIWGLPIMLGYLAAVPLLVLPAAWWRQRRTRRGPAVSTP